MIKQAHAHIISMIDLQATALKGFVEGLGCSQNKCPLGTLLGMHRFSEMP